MNLHIASASAERSHNSIRCRTPSTHAEWIFCRALNRCYDELRNRQQSVMVVHTAFEAAGDLDGETLADLLARALQDMSALSRRGAVLSLTAADSAIVIESHHPLEIPGDGLKIDGSVQQEAHDMRIAAEMTWEQGRGPRLTLTLPQSRPARVSARRA